MGAEIFPLKELRHGLRIMTCLEKPLLNSLLVIRVYLLQPTSSLYLYGLLLLPYWSVFMS